MAAAEEIVLEEWVIRLDGNVVELLHETGVGYRYHVAHVAVEAKPTDDGMTLRVGIDSGGTIVEGAKVPVPLERQGEVESMFTEARRRRDGLA